MENKPFNIVIAGIGGQGTLTLGDLISNAALASGKDIKNCSLHGLAKRFGAIETHVRFGDGKIYSPLVTSANADLIFGLEPIEALRACRYASEKTTFIIDTKLVIPISVHLEKKNYPTLNEILKQMKTFSKNIFALNASEDAKKNTGTPLAANSYMLGFAVGKKLIPLEEKIILETMEKNFPAKLLEMNKKAFEMGFEKKSEL